VLIHAGDFTNLGGKQDLTKFVTFLERHRDQYKQIILIAGNHDLSLDTEFYDREWQEWHRKGKIETALLDFKADLAKRVPNAVYLEDELCVTDGGLRVWGSPWTPYFHGWGFNLNRGQSCDAKWAEAPDDVDLLLTHGPPLGRGDQCLPRKNRAGCADLLRHVRRIRPMAHVFGHIHEGAGVSSDGVTDFVNASTCTFAYRPTNGPIILDLPRRV
jgi:predicted phosphodiesterase